MISIETLPIDENGIVQGVWRLVHEQPGFTGYCGGVEMRDGVGLAPAFGRQLFHIAAECGSALYLEPWGTPLPRGFTLPDGFTATVPAAVLARLQVCPWREAPAAAPTAAAEAPKPAPLPEPTPEPEAAVSEPEDGAAVNLDAIETMGRGELLKVAEQWSILVDRRWGVDRLRDAVLDALTS